VLVSRGHIKFEKFHLSPPPTKSFELVLHLKGEPFFTKVVYSMKTVFQNKSFLYQTERKGEKSKVAKRLREKEGESASVGG